MNIEEVRLCALALPRVTEDMPFGDNVVTFRIEGKIFLCLWLDGESPRFALKLRPERNEELRVQYGSITPAWHWNKKHWSDVHCSMLDNSLVENLIHESYHLVLSLLPRRIREGYTQTIEEQNMGDTSPIKPKTC